MSPNVERNCLKVPTSIIFLDLPSSSGWAQNVKIEKEWTNGVLQYGKE